MEPAAPVKVYVAGPMSGIPGFNIPAFDALARELRGRGLEVVSPAEMDGPVTRKHLLASRMGDHGDLPPGETWGFYLARDVQLLADDGIQGVVVLPDWDRSRGARLEVFLASQILDLPILALTGSGLVELSYTTIWEGVRR